LFIGIVLAPIVSADDQFEYHMQKAHEWQQKADALKNDPTNPLFNYCLDRSDRELAQANPHAGS
jgi:hypothetical protein